MWRLTKKVLALVLCVCVLAGSLLIPLPAGAEDEPGPAPTIATLGPNPIYAVGQKLGIEVHDASQTGQTLTVQAISATVPDGTEVVGSVVVTLKADPNSAGRFAGTVEIAGDDAPDAIPPRIHAVNGNGVTFTYFYGEADSVFTDITVADRAVKPEGTLNEGGNQLTLASITGDATIYYSAFTGDANEMLEPDRSKTKYEDEDVISIEGFTVIKAIAVKAGMADSEIANFAYNAIPVKVTDPIGEIAYPNCRVEILNGNGDVVKNSNTDSSGYAYFNPTGMDGAYRVKAYPPGNSSFGVSAVTEFSVSNGVYSAAEIDINLTTPIFSGKIVKPDGSPANDGWVDIEKYVENNNTQYQIGLPVQADGTYNLPFLDDGNYRIRVNASEESPYVSSNWEDFSVVSGTVGEAIPNLKFNTVQIQGTVKDPNGTDVDGGQYYIRIEPANGQGNPALQYSAGNWAGNYKAGGLSAGEYTVQAVSTNPIGFSSSFKIPFTVDGSTLNEEHNLTLTTPQITGIVKNTTGQAVGGGNVDIFSDARGMHFIGSIPVANDGQYKIGGLDNATYYLRANPQDWDMYEPSVFTEAIIGESPYTVDITLHNRQIRVLRAEPYAVGDEWLSVWVSNSNLINGNDFSASIDQYPDVSLSDCQVEFFGAEAKIRFRVNGSLPYGIKTIHVNKGEDPLEPDNENSDKLTVVQRLECSPGIVTPSQYGTGITFQLKPGTIKIDQNDVTPSPIWENALPGTVTVKVRANENNNIEEFNDTVTPDEDANTIHVTIEPPPQANGGNRTVEVYINGVLSAQGGFTVGDAVINNAFGNEGKNFILVQGEYLENWRDAKAELLKDGVKVSDSNQTDFWGDLNFQFPVSLNSGSSYQVRILVNGMPVNGEGKTCTIIPKLICDNPVVSPEHTAVNIQESTLPGFDWDQGDDLSVWVSGPDGFHQEFTRSSGITVYNGYLALDLGALFNDQSPAPGEYGVDIFQGDTRLGYAEIIIAGAADDVLSGTVTNPNAPSVPSNGGKIVIRKQDAGDWETSVLIGHDGKYYIRKDQVDYGDGTYIMAAVPPESSPNAASAFKQIKREGNKIEDDNGTAINTLDISLNTIQVSGVVRANGLPLTSGNIDFRDPANNWNSVGWVDIQPDGTYKIGGFTTGKRYALYANPLWEQDYLSSNEVFVTVYGNPITQNINCEVPQIRGNVHDVHNNPISGYGYNVFVRSLDGTDNPNGEPKKRESSFLLGKLKPGKYALSIIPDGNSPYARSAEKEVTIQTNGTASVPVMDLALTQPVLTGSAFYMDGTEEVPLGNGYVEVLRGNRNDLQHIYSAPVDGADGSFKLGGLPDGEYYIRAGSSDWWDEEREINPNELYGRSRLKKITIPGDTDVRLQLTDREVPRVQWINNPPIGSNDLRLHLANYRKNGDMSKYTAEIKNKDGTQVVAIVPQDNVERTSGDWNSDECDLRLLLKDSQGREVYLNGGEYLLELKYDGTPLTFDGPDGNSFAAVLNLTAAPKGALQDQTDHLQVKLFVDDGRGGIAHGKLDKEDVFTAEVLTSEAKTLNAGTCVNNGDDTLTVTIPQILPIGWNSIKIYHSGKLAGTASILVGSPVIREVWDINEGDGHINAAGYYLASLEAPTTVGEVLGTDGELICTTSAVSFQWDRLEFDFGKLSLAPGEYRFRIKAGGLSVTADPLPFRVAPRLPCDTFSIDQGTTVAKTLVFDVSSLDLDDLESVENFRVNINRDGFELVLEHNHLSLSPDKSKLSVTIPTDNDWIQNLAAYQGMATLEIFHNDIKAGFNRFAIGKLAIRGTLLDAQNNPVAGAGVNLASLDTRDGGRIEMITDANGHFNLATFELPAGHLGGMGRYSLVATTADGALSVAKIVEIDRNGDNGVELKFEAAQLTGHILGETAAAAGCHVDINRIDSQEYPADVFTFYADANGNFHLSGLPAGSYHVAAYPSDGSSYVPSQPVRISVDSNGTVHEPEIDLALTEVQFSGAVKGMDGTLLNRDQYMLDIQAEDPNDHTFEQTMQWRKEDGKYFFGGLIPGVYYITLLPRDLAGTPSYRTRILVDGDGSVAGNSDLPLQLTEPVVVGKVTIPGESGEAFTQGYVDVFTGTWQNLAYVSTVGLDENGKFQLGGLPAGTYFLRAVPGEDSALFNTAGQSRLTSVVIPLELPAQPIVQNLQLTDKTLRIRQVENVLAGNQAIRVRLVNISKLLDAGRNVDYSKFKAEILDKNHNSIGRVIAGSNETFWLNLDPQAYDAPKDETDLWIGLHDIPGLETGEYNLKLTYNGNVLANETPEDGDGFNGFQVYSNLKVSPFVILPEEVSTAVLTLQTGDKPAGNPWNGAETVTIRITDKMGNTITWQRTAAADKTLTTTLSALDVGEYGISVLRGAQVLASSRIVVGRPVIQHIRDLNEDSDVQPINGINLGYYAERPLTAKIYENDGSTPIFTGSNFSFEYSDLLLKLDGYFFKPGDYKLELYDGETKLSLPNGGKFTVSTMLYATPGYVLSSNVSGKKIILKTDGSESLPWTAGNTLKVTLINESTGKEFVFDPQYIAVNANDLTITLPNLANWQEMLQEGTCVLIVNRPSDDKYLGFAHFNMVSKVQLSGQVRDKANQPIPYAGIYVVTKDDNWYRGFMADADGKYVLYGIEPGEYFIMADSPKGKAYMPSDKFALTVDAGTTGTHDFTLQDAKRISGTIRLEEGKTAPLGGIHGYIGDWTDAGTPNNPEDDKHYGHEFTIGAGKNSVDYALLIPDNSDNPEHQDLYFVEAWCSGQGIDDTATRYSSHGSVSTLDEADRLSSTQDYTGIDLMLRQGNKVSGTLSLPDGAAPKGGIGVNVTVFMDQGTDNPFDDVAAGADLTIPAGESSVEYSLFVPKLSAYKVSYRMLQKSSYLDEGFYQSGEATTYRYTSASAIDVTGADAGGIDLQLIPGRTISGVIKLPGSDEAGTGGITGKVSVWNESGTDDQSDDLWYGSDFTIEPRKNKTEFSLQVPVTETPYLLVLSAKGDKMISGAVVYNQNGSVFTATEATPLYVNEENQTGIVFGLAYGKTISGTLTLPAVALEDRSFRVHAFIDKDNEDYRDDVDADVKVTVKAGDTSAPYSMIVPVMAGYRVEYGFEPEYPYEKVGFYSTQGTVYNKEMASTVDGTADQPGINLAVSSILAPVCIKATAVEDGTAIRLFFSKPLKKTSIPAAPAGFTVKVGSDTYTVGAVTPNDKGNELLLQLNGDQIFKDYANISVDYTNTAGIISEDDMPLAAFNMAAGNSSRKTFSMITGFANGAIMNRNAVIDVSTSNSAITIKDGGTGIASGSTTATAIIATEGLHTVTVEVAGRKNPSVITFTIDKTAPGIGIDNSSTVRNSRAGVLPVVSFDPDCVAGSKTITLNGQSYDGKTAIVKAGKYVLTASAKDAAGNVRVVTKEFEVIWDTSAPVIGISGVSDGQILESAALGIVLSRDANTTEVNSNESNYSYTCTLKLPGGTPVAFDKNSIPVLSASGLYRLEIRAVNPSYTDITSSKVIEFTIDKTDPTVEIANISGTPRYNTSVIPIIRFADDVASQQTLLANATVTLTRSAILVPQYNMGDAITADGEYILSVKTRDAFGHESEPKTVTFTIDKTKPVISISGILNGYTYKDQNVTAAIRTNEGTLVVKNNGSAVNPEGNGLYVFPVSTGNIIVNNLTIQATDDAGNVSEQQLTFTLDGLPVNIIVNGVSEGMLVNYNPDISFITYDGSTPKTGTKAKIDGTDFTGGSYGVAGTHELVLTYTSGGSTYSKTVHFTIDKTAPTAAVSGILHNNQPASGMIYAKAGDSIKVRAVVSDPNGINGVTFSIGSVASGIPMKPVNGQNYYEGEYFIGSGNYTDQDVTVTVFDAAGNRGSAVSAKAIAVDNTKPSVNAATTPSSPDGKNGIYKAAGMTVRLSADSKDTLYYYFNGVDATTGGAIQLVPSQGTNILIYYAKDQAGNQSDQKAMIFEYDSVKPSNVIVTSAGAIVVNTATVALSGTVLNEGGKAGSKVLLKKSGEIVSSTNIMPDGSFVMDGVRLAEGSNSFTLTAIDLAGNESAELTMVTRTLDSTPPILTLIKNDDTHYQVTANEDIKTLTAKFNGVDPAGITEVSGGQARTYVIQTAEPVEGTNTLNVYGMDMAGNSGSGSYTSTFIKARTQQNDMPLSDNTTMDIPGDAFSSSVQMLVKSVSMDEMTSYKPLGAAISFEFKDNETNETVEPDHALVIKNYIGVGLNGVSLMHVTSTGAIDATIAAVVTTSGAFDMNSIENTGGKLGTKSLEVFPAGGSVVYISDTGYLVFKTKTFSGYAFMQDVTAPDIALTTTDLDINKADMYAGHMHIAGTLKMGGGNTAIDTGAVITEVTVDSTPLNLNGDGMDTGSGDGIFDIPLNMTDGTHEVVVKAKDASNNESTLTRTYNVDITPPVLTVGTTVTGTNSNTAEISVQLNEPSHIIINNIDIGDYNGNSIIPYTLIDGQENHIRVTATDTFGNAAEAPEIVVTRDSTAPVISITGVSNNGVYGRGLDIGVTVTDIHTTSASITMDGVEFIPGSYSVEGQHTLRVEASDEYGNTSVSTVVFTIDRSVPVINISGVTNNGIYAANKTVTVSIGNATESTVTLSVDGATAQPAPNMTVTGGAITLGTDDQQHIYKITVTATKILSGTVQTATDFITFTVDRKAPVLTSTTAASTQSGSINLTGTVSEPADIYLNNELIISGNPAGAFTITGRTLVSGSNVFTVKAVDAAGNLSTLTITVNKTEPTPETPVIIGGGGFGGFPAAPAADVPENATITKKPVLTGTTASSAATAEEVAAAFEQAVADKAGVKTILIKVQELPGAKTYEQELPASVMQAGNTRQYISLDTPLAKITLPGTMFKAPDIWGSKSVAISVGVADKSKLDKETAGAIGNAPVIDLKASVDGKTIAWNNPGAPVTVSVAYKPTEAELKNPEHIVVWYIDGSGKAAAVPDGKYDVRTGMVTFTTTHFSRYAIAFVNKTFTDLGKYGWARNAIEVMAAKGIINGKTTTTYAPGSYITRAEFVTMLVGSMGLTATVDSNFSDISKTAYYYEAVGIAKKLGIIGAAAAGSLFRPNEQLTRQDMMLMVYNALKLRNKLGAAADTSLLANYRDAGKIAAYAKTGIAQLLKDGVVQGSGNAVNPLGFASRAEMAVLMYRIYYK